jgi:hypothetical protein
MEMKGLSSIPNRIHELLLDIKPGPECWLKVFTILLQMDMGHHIDELWRNHFVDRRLPFSKEECGKISRLLQLDSADTFANNFFELQYQLCAEESLDSPNGQMLDSMRILPVCKLEPVKPDRTVIFLIEVPHECIPKTVEEKIKRKPRRKGGKNGEVLPLLVLPRC